MNKLSKLSTRLLFHGTTGSTAQKSNTTNTDTIDKRSTIDESEVSNFAQLGTEWWNKDGSQKMLHLMNGPRAEYIYSRLSDSVEDLTSLHYLDVGCGGGLLTENLARFGGHATGIDVSNENIAIAEWHKSTDPILSKNPNLQYKMTPIEELAEINPGSMDVVVSLEVLEHVKDPDYFIECCQKMVKPGGHLFLSTINRTFLSYMLGIFAAEYILRWLPVGTHDHTKFITPRELKTMIHENSEFSVQDVAGLSFDIPKGEWYVSEDTNLNYLLHATRNA